MIDENLLKCEPVDISDVDVVTAMKAIPGYIDITPADFREVYRLAYRLAKERMMNVRKAADVMTAPVHALERDQDLVTAATLLAEKGVSGAPVVDRAGKVIGVISEKDFLRKMGAGTGGSFMRVLAHCLKNKGCAAGPMLDRTVGDLMSVPAITAPADISIVEISALFATKKINRLPIVGNDGALIGIVTRSDLVNSFCIPG
ncbi:MAG: CBS domain-containing protein [Pseudomonadota bacterium]